MRMIIDGTEIRAVTLQTARTRDIMALQAETGLKLNELVAKARDDEVWGLKAMEFLAEHNRGRFVTFDELLDRPLPSIALDEADKVRQAEDPQGAGQDPTTAGSTASPAATAPAPAPASTEPPSASTTPSPGSSSRSDLDS